MTSNFHESPFVVELEQASQAFKAATREQDGEGQREAVGNALGIVLDYLHSLGTDRAVLEPLHFLMAVLGDLNHGTVSPLLLPVKKTGRGKQSIYEAQRKAAGALAITLFMKSGDSRQVAADKVVKGTSGLFDNSQQAISFRDNLRRRRVRKEAYDSYFRMQDLASEFEPNSCALDLIQFLKG